MIDNKPKLIKKFLIIIEDLVAKLIDNTEEAPSVYQELHYNLQVLLMDFRGSQEEKLADYRYRWEVKKLLLPCYKYLKVLQPKDELEERLLSDLTDLFEVLD